MRLADLAAHLDAFLRTAEFRDWPDAFNGLQLENAGEVTRVAAAVDACQAVVDAAAQAGADLLLVHHGLFWGTDRPLTGRAFRKIERLIRAGVAVYASHLPLDAHPEVGNNAELARLLGLVVTDRWGEVYGTPVGVRGTLAAPRGDLAAQVGRVLCCEPRLLAFGPERCEQIGVMTGAGGSMIRDAAAAGLDTLITGEGAHWTYFDAEESGVNVIFAGHYATETLGVKALAAHLEKQFGLPWLFVDHPTGM